MALYKKHPESTVVVLPSDHCVLEERLFMRHVKVAFSVVEQNPSQLVVLGVQPTDAETEFGYILPKGEDLASSPKSLCRVKQFVEKPEKQAAEKLILQGGLWNTMVIVANTRSLLGLVRQVLPDLYSRFEKIYEALGTPAETKVMEEVYKELRPVNFSKEFLEILPSQFPAVLSALPVRGVFWSDMGLPHYVETAHRKIADRLRTPPEELLKTPFTTESSLSKTI
jgi:mannose-1-phosphate guanylyltransferase